MTRGRQHGWKLDSGKVFLSKDSSWPWQLLNCHPTAQLSEGLRGWQGVAKGIGWQCCSRLRDYWGKTTYLLQTSGTPEWEAGGEQLAIAPPLPVYWRNGDHCTPHFSRLGDPGLGKAWEPFPSSTPPGPREELRRAKVCKCSDSQEKLFQETFLYGYFFPGAAVFALGNKSLNVCTLLISIGLSPILLARCNISKVNLSLSQLLSTRDTHTPGGSWESSRGYTWEGGGGAPPPTTSCHPFSGAGLGGWGGHEVQQRPSAGRTGTTQPARHGAGEEHTAPSTSSHAPPLRVQLPRVHLLKGWTFCKFSSLDVRIQIGSLGEWYKWAKLTWFKKKSHQVTKLSLSIYFTIVEMREFYFLFIYF